MAGEQIIIPNPSQEFLIGVIKDPKLENIDPQNGSLKLSATEGWGFYPLNDPDVVKVYLEMCRERRILPYSTLDYKYYSRVAGLDIGGYVAEPCLYPDFDQMLPDSGYVQNMIYEGVNDRLGKGERFHLMRYRFDRTSFGAFKAEVHDKVREGYYISGLEMVLADLLTMRYGPEDGLVLSGLLGNWPKTVDWFAGLTTRLSERE